MGPRNPPWHDTRSGTQGDAPMPEVYDESARVDDHEQHERERRHVVQGGAQVNRDSHERYVFTTLVRCPVCRSDRHRVYGALKRKGEPRAQYARCEGEGCGHKFLIIFEDEIQPR
jgi:hypothetical protein